MGARTAVTSLRALVVDDEPLIRLGVRRALEALPAIDVVGECGSGPDAVAAITASTPDVVVLDVQMPGFSGLDVVREVGPARMPAVIFLTAYDEYAVQAFEVNAVDYLLKPFDPERLGEAVDRVRTRLASRESTTLAERLEALLRPRSAHAVERLVVRNGERYEFVPVDAVDWIEAANNHVQLHCGARHHLLAETLTHLEGRLDKRRFLRVHRSRIVNTSRIVAVHVVIGGTYEIELRDGTRLTSGRQYRDAVQALIHT
jgi:two-component system LytT family response regulator